MRLLVAQPRLPVLAQRVVVGERLMFHGLDVRVPEPLERDGAQLQFEGDDGPVVPLNDEDEPVRRADAQEERFSDSWPAAATASR
ncbi:hypothetical protein GCM10022295_90300 [Streptomyces osmaniensis]|uniref:Uncharacterized protein n=1 Tax=Streptomyces osmaniensis TaxID=593134 RepID=A0ABP6Z1D1_9ACTN